MALTDAQMTDVRRYAGYQLAGTTQPLNSNYDITYLVFGTYQMSLYTRLTTLSASEEAVLVTYLTQLASLETDIFGARVNLDTAQASVWTHNPREQADREALFASWRMKMCAFIGLPPGPGLGAATTTARG